MSLYLEYKVKTNQNDTITGISYHRQLGLLTILSHTSNDEAQIIICDEIVSKILINCAIFTFIVFRAIIYLILNQTSVRVM